MQLLAKAPILTIVPPPPEPPQERTLRPYQEKAKKEIYDNYKAAIKSVLFIGTGGLGKTTIAAWIMRDRAIRARVPSRAIFLVERNCLLEQTRNTLQSLGVECSIIQGNRKVKWEHKCMVASLQTLRSWADNGKNLHKMLGKVGLFVLDEAHDGVGQKIYQDLCEAYKDDPKCYHLGLTASPWRMKREEYLGKWFQAKVESLQPPEAVAEGWLAPARIYSRSGVFDFSEVGTGNDGDFVDGQMGRQAMRPEALKLVVDEWERLGEGKPTLCFCASLAQAIAQAGYFNMRGIAADWQCGGTPDSKRESQDLDLRQGRLKVICSVNTQTKGYDCPPVGCIIFVRGTKSKSLFFQAAWRGCRPWSGDEFIPRKDYWILMDFGDNIDGNGSRIGHGNPMGYQVYDISEPRKIEKSEDDGYKICPNCDAKVLVFARVCKCGHEFGQPNDGEQQEIFDPSLFTLREWFDSVGCEQIQFLRSQKHRHYQEGKHPDLAVGEFKARFGFIPPNDWHLYACCGKRASKAQREQYELWLKQHLPNDFVVRVHMRLEFGDKHTKQPSFLSRWDEPWWTVLGIGKRASKSEAKQAYLQLSRQWHPDVCSDTANAETQMKILNKAWDDFKNHAKIKQ